MHTVPRKGLWTLAIHCNNGEHRLVKGNRIHGESGVKICLSEDDILVNSFILRNPIAGHLSVAVDLREAKGEVDVVDVPDLLLAPGQRDEGNYLSHSCLHLVYHLAMAMASFRQWFLTADDDDDDDDDDDHIHKDLHVVLVESPAPDTKVVTQLVWEDALWNDTHTSLDLPPAIYCHIYVTNMVETSYIYRTWPTPTRPSI